MKRLQDSDLEQEKEHGLAWPSPDSFSSEADVSAVQAEQGSSTSCADSMLKAEQFVSDASVVRETYFIKNRSASIQFN